MPQKKCRKHKKLWITLGVISAVVVLMGILFYRVYLYRPYIIASGGWLESWDVSLQSGMLVVSARHAWPDGTPPEVVERAMALENGVIQEHSAN